MTLTDLHLKILFCLDGKMQWVKMPWNKQVMNGIEELLNSEYVEKREEQGVQGFFLTQVGADYLKDVYEKAGLTDSQTD